MKWYNPILFYKLFVKNKNTLDLIFFPISYSFYIIDYLFNKPQLREYIQKEIKQMEDR